MRALAAFAVVAVVAAGCTGGDDAGPNPRTPQPAPRSNVDAELRLTVRAGSGGPELEVRATAPPRATEMQVTTDPSFDGAPWRPVGDAVRLPVDAGYQEVFARFRTGEDAEPTAAVVAGRDVDPAAAAATADPPRPAAIGLATPTDLVVDVEVGRVDRGAAEPGDERRGADVDGADLERGWTVTGPEGRVRVRSVDRSTIPIDTARDDEGGVAGFAVRHRITLRLGEALSAGTYRVRSPLGTTSVFRFDDRTSPSPSVHANQVGSRPGDVAKVAYLAVDPAAGWPRSAPAFHLVDTADGRTVFDGVATPRRLGPDGEAGHGDLTGLDVWQLDASAWTTPGRYRWCVDGIGCSDPFSVDEDSTWFRVATTIARALYHQRSGIALGQPTTSVARPRPDHPDDGLVVHQSSLTALEAARLPDDQLFERLVAGASDEVVDGAWGGHFDAGDWDRRAQHLWMARDVLDLARIAPDRFARRDLALPESGDAVPDLVDEAMWTVDLFRRLQRTDGAVRGGIESERFPDPGVSSWRDGLRRFAYAPDPWTTYAYVSAAVDASMLLVDVAPDRAADLADSARRAMAWADGQQVADDDAEQVTGQRAVAAAAMLRLTGDRHWNDEFAAATPFAAGPTATLGCNGHDLCDAAWEYLWAPAAATDPALVAAVSDSFVRAADRSADAADTTLFGWCLEDPDVPLIWGLGIGGAPHAVTLLRAWLLTGTERYRAAAERCAAVSLGANPLGVSYVTGLGAHPARHPLIVDVNTGDLPAWAGTPVYGSHLPVDDFAWAAKDRLAAAGATHDVMSAPYVRSWYDLGDVGPMNEFTVYQSHGPALWVAGVLASRQPVAP